MARQRNQDCNNLKLRHIIWFRLVNQLGTYAIAFITVLCVVATIFFAYNSSIYNPNVTSFIAGSPARTILIVNIMSQITWFALAELTAATMDTIKWVFASSATGTSALTFLALSKATTFLGALILLLRSGNSGGTIERNAHRVWGAQRYIFVLDDIS